MPMRAKEALVRKSAFPFLPASLLNEPVVTLGIAHQTATKDIINKVLMTQSTLKVPRLDKFNFRILCIVWG